MTSFADDRGASFRATLNGTHLGDFAGVPATRRAIEVHLVDFMEIKDGKIVAQWGARTCGTCSNNSAPP
jgi:predicted ester cyclase